MKSLATCCTTNPRKYGKYRRKSDSQLIQRYRCRHCGRSFSSATFHPACWQKKRQLNTPISKLLVSGVSMNRAAFILNTTYKTVARKLVYLSSEVEREWTKMRSEMAAIETVMFDDLQTIEHTKCKPLSVTMAVVEESRKILGFRVSSMPATGHLAKISRRKYGPRPDHRKGALDSLFEELREGLPQKVGFKSDLCPYYEPVLRRHFPGNVYIQSKGDKATIAGQGELKKRGNDPLFAVNHTFAMLRANINRLIRRTWCTTKRPDRLVAHLNLYCWFHNMKLTVEA